MITIKQFVFNSFATNTYVVSDETNKCVIIDAGCYDDKERVKLTGYIESNKLEPVALLNTHCHVDHVCGVAYLKEKYDLDFYANDADNYLLDTVVASGSTYGMEIEQPPKIDKVLKDGEIFKFGNLEFKICQVPGHSKGSLAFYNEKEKILFSGDVLFDGSIGRTDLDGGDLEVLLNSIKEKLFKLPEDTEVLSGHGGPTRIGKEINSNPFLLDNVL